MQGSPLGPGRSSARRGANGRDGEAAKALIFMGSLSGPPGGDPPLSLRAGTGAEQPGCGGPTPGWPGVTASGSPVAPGTFPKGAGPTRLGAAARLLSTVSTDRGGAVCSASAEFRTSAKGSDRRNSGIENAPGWRAPGSGIPGACRFRFFRLRAARRAWPPACARWVCSWPLSPIENLSRIPRAPGARSSRPARAPGGVCP